MDKKELARILINSNENEKGGLPIFLNVDNEDIAVNLEDMHNFIVVGPNSNATIDDLIDQIGRQWVTIINNSYELSEAYNNLMSNFYNREILVPPQIIVIPDIAVFSGEEIKMLREMLNHGTSIHSYFICACKTNTIADQYDVAIPVKMYDGFEPEEKDRIENLITFSGTVRKISR